MIPFTFWRICGMVGFSEYETGGNINLNGKSGCIKPTKGEIK